MTQLSRTLTLLALLIASTTCQPYGYNQGGQSEYNQGGQLDYNQGGQSAYNQGGQSPYNRGGQSPYNRGGQSPYNRGGQSPYNRGGQSGQKQGQSGSSQEGYLRQHQPCNQGRCNYSYLEMLVPGTTGPLRCKSGSKYRACINWARSLNSSSDCECSFVGSIQTTTCAECAERILGL